MPIPLRILIVDDDFVTLDTLRDVLTDMGYVVAGDAMSVEEAEQVLLKEEIDFAILDINLGAENDGISLGHKLKDNYGIPFIYLTAYSDGATISAAAQTQPFGYIIKPFSAADIHAAIEVAIGRREIEQKDIQEIFLRDGEKFYKIKIEHIRYVKVYRNYLEIHTLEDSYVIRSTLKDFSKRLPENIFFQPHRSYLVNGNHVQGYKNGALRLGSSIEIPVSRMGKTVVNAYYSQK